MLLSFIIRKTRKTRQNSFSTASYQARKYLGALAAVLGGLDTLVFTGGIGEHAAHVRLRICEGLEFLGIRLDPRRNEVQVPVISREGTSATVARHEDR